MFKLLKINVIYYYLGFYCSQYVSYADNLCKQFGPWSGQTFCHGYGNMIRCDPMLVDLTSNFFILCINVKDNLYNYSLWLELSMNIHERN